MCHQPGERVKTTTVKNLVQPEFTGLVGDVAYHLCLHPECPVVYFSESGPTFLQTQLQVPVWYKTGAHPQYICYCNRLTREQISEAVISRGARTVKEVARLTGAMQNARCELNNPTGRCCGTVIQDLINSLLSNNPQDT
ncbi:MAG: (2Fe-2S)-binding protein [Desulfurispora sp.]|uniref:(2Fe-2S)-binding protein n=1 Tax=Desulfurispora sp. TaxID=3014275 RepID=UPI0040490BB6